MGFVTNEKGFQAASEFIQRPRIDLDALEDAANNANQVLGTGFNIPLDPLSGITYDDILESPPEDVPWIYETENPRSDVLKKTDLYRCDPDTQDLVPIDCSTCQRNPLAFVPDWTALPDNDIIFDGKRCVYSIVLDTGVIGIPTNSFVIELLKSRGLLEVLEFLNRPEVMTTVTYQPLKNQASGEDVIKDTKTGAFIIGAVGLATLIGMPFGIGAILGGVGLAALVTPKRKNGFRRILEEYQTVPTLLETNLDDAIPSVFDQSTAASAVIIEYFVPAGETVPTRALVSVDAQTIERIPEKIQVDPSDLYSSPSEVTFTGEDYNVIFRDVARNLKRSNQYVLNTQTDPEYAQQIYLQDGSSNDPLVIDFKEEADKLNEFQDTVLTPALLTVIGTKLKDLEKIVISFKETADDKIRIEEVLANAGGCPVVKLSKHKKIPEVRELFNFKRSRTLSYVGQLPDMYSYLRGKNPVEWLEFVTEFTHPGIEFQNTDPYNLNLIGGSGTVGSCIAEQSINQIVNSVLNSILSAGDLYLSQLGAELCIPEEDALENDEAFRTARKRMREELKNLDTSNLDSPAARKQARENIKAGYEKEIAVEQVTNKERKIRIFQEHIRRGIFSQNYLAYQPLARVLAMNIVRGVDISLQKNLAKKEGSLAADREFFGALAIPPQPLGKIFSLDNIQTAVDTTMGGWCGWLSLILEALQCVLSGIGIDDARKTIAQRALAGLSPFEFQKLFARMDPEARERIRQALMKAIGPGTPGAPSILFPWENDFNSTHSYNKNRFLEQLIEQNADYNTVRAQVEADAAVVRAAPGGIVSDAAIEQTTQKRLEEAREEAQAEADKKDAERAENRRRDATAGPFGHALGSLQKELTDILIDEIMDTIGLDDLFDLLDDVPGFAILVNFFKDDACKLPELPLTSPPLDSFLKTLKLEICKTGPGKKVDLTLPKFIGLKSGIKNLFYLLNKASKDALLAIAAQLLLQILAEVIQTILDAACQILALGGASLADAINGNTEFRDALKDALCPDGNLSDEQFADTLLNISNALANGDPDQNCMRNLTSQEMADFIDNIMIVLTYEQLFSLLIGSPSAQTLTVVSNIAKSVGSDCIAEIFGNPTNVIDFFKGIGDLVDARGVFDVIGDGLIPGSTIGICPPEVLDYVNDLKAKLLRDKGLTPEQIQDQLDFLKQQAINKLEDLVIGIQEGPYSELPSLDSTGVCPSDGILTTYDPSLDMGFDILTDSIFDPIQTSQLKDLIGKDGIFNKVLSDTNGRPLRSHRFMTNGLFGNNIGSTNFLWQWYSDDTLRYGRVGEEGEDDEEEVDIITKQRINQFGDRVDLTGGKVSPLSLFEAVGGFPPTIGSHLMDKFKTVKIGYVDPGTHGGSEGDYINQDEVNFKSSFITQEKIDEYEERILYNERLIRKRQQFVAMWAIASGFVTWDIIKPYYYDLDNNGDFKLTQVQTARDGAQTTLEPAVKLLQLDSQSIECLNNLAKKEGSISGVNPNVLGVPPIIDVLDQRIQRDTYQVVPLADREAIFNLQIELCSTWDGPNIPGIMLSMANDLGDEIPPETVADLTPDISPQFEFLTFLTIGSPKTLDVVFNETVVDGLQMKDNWTYPQYADINSPISIPTKAIITRPGGPGRSEGAYGLTSTGLSKLLDWMQSTFPSSEAGANLKDILYDLLYATPEQIEFLEDLDTSTANWYKDVTDPRNSSDANPETFTYEDMFGDSNYWIERTVTPAIAWIYIKVMTQSLAKNIGVLQESRAPEYGRFLENPSPSIPDLAMSFLSYGEVLSPPFGATKNLSPSAPGYAFDILYNNTIQKEENKWSVVPEDKYKFRVTLNEKINPFNDPAWDEQYADALIDLQNEGSNLQLNDAPNDSPSATSTDAYTTFDKELEASLDEEVKDYVEYLLLQEKARPKNTTYESEVFTRYLNQKIAEDFKAVRPSGLGSNLIINDSTRKQIQKFYDMTNQGFVSRIALRLGYGDGTSKIKVNDANGVAKKADDTWWPFDKEQSDDDRIKVICPDAFKFGYSVKKQPKVKILDHRVYGGTAENPPFYINPPKYDGWLGILADMVPEEDACEPRRVPVYDLRDIKASSKQLYNELKEDERLQFLPTCTKEAPYDAIFDKSTLSNIDGVIRSIARVNALDFLMKALPVFSQFEINFDSNFDEILQAYLGDYTLEAVILADIQRKRKPMSNVVLVNENNRITQTNIKKVTNDYYYGLLEQVGNLIARKIDSGVIKVEDLTPDQQQAYTNIVETVQQYYVDFDGTLGVISEEAIEAQNMFKRALNALALRNQKNVTLGHGSSTFSKVEARRVKEGLLYGTLERTESDARELFSVYLKEELESLGRSLNDTLKPPVDSLDLLFLSNSQWMNGGAKTETGPYDVVSDPRNPLAFNIDLNAFTDSLGRPGDDRKPKPGSPKSSPRWPYVLEKYIIVDDKASALFKDPRIIDLIQKRPDNLYGIINLNDWQAFINTIAASNVFKLDGQIGDYFGPGVLETDDDPSSPTFGEEIIKNTGLRFGLRISMCFDVDDPHAKPFLDVANSASEDVRLKTKAYKLTTSEVVVDKRGVPNAKPQILIPLVNAELPVRQQRLENFNIDQYDLNCLINEMIKSRDFKTLFRYIFPYKRYLSMLTIYCATAFYQSVGNTGRPDQGGDRWVPAGGRRMSGFRRWDKRGFVNTNKELMRTFLALYNTKNPIIKSRSSSEEPKASSIRELLEPLVPVNLLDGIPWWRRKYRVARPYDAFGSICDPEEDDS